MELKQSSWRPTLATIPKKMATHIRSGHCQSPNYDRSQPPAEERQIHPKCRQYVPVCAVNPVVRSIDVQTYDANAKWYFKAIMRFVSGGIRAVSHNIASEQNFPATSQGWHLHCLQLMLNPHFIYLFFAFEIHSTFIVIPVVCLQLFIGFPIGHQE